MAKKMIVLNAQQQKMVEDNLQLAKGIAKLYKDRGVELAELQQVAMEWLCKAAVYYKCVKGASFSTYATRVISGGLTRFIERDILHTYYENGELVFVNMTSLDKHLSDGEDGARLSDVMSSDDYEERVRMGDIRDTLKECMECLTADEKELVMCRFGMAGPKNSLKRLRDRKYKKELMRQMYRKCDAAIEKMKRFAQVNKSSIASLLRH